MNAIDRMVIGVGELTIDELAKRSREVGERVKRSLENMRMVLWEEAAPIVRRVLDEKLWEKFGYGSFGEFVLAHYGVGSRIAYYWAQIDREMLFLTPVQKAHIPERKLIQLSCMVVKDRGAMVEDGRPTAKFLSTFRKMMSSDDQKEWEESTEESPFLRLSLRVDKRARLAWLECKRAYARVEGVEYPQDRAVLEAMAAEFLQAVDSGDKNYLASLRDWIREHLLSEKEKG